MYPIICTIGPFNVYAYGLMLALAFVVSATLVSLKAKRQNLDPDIIFNLCFVIVISGVIGARIFYIAANLNYYLKNPLETIMLQHGGLAWFGSLILGGVSGIAYINNKKLPTYQTLDLMAPFLALGQAIGRIGCLLNGCCFGKASACGFYFPAHEEWLIPTQAWSSLILVFIFLILRILQERPHRAGGIFFIYLLLYSAKRFFIEFWRADNPQIIFGLTLFQLLSIAVFFLALAGLIFIKKRRQ